MRNSVDKILQSKLARYILVGGTSYLIELIVIFSLVALGVKEIISVAISFWIGLAISFILQKVFAFGNRDRTVKKLAWQSTSYGALVAINYFFTLTVVTLTTPLVGLFIARTAALIITTLWNYFAYKSIIFKESL